MSQRFTTEVRVEWGDVDLVGVVYFPQFFRYFSVAEAAFYRSLGLTLLELEESLEIRLPRVEAFCRYHRPARFGDQLQVSLEIGRVGSKTVKYLFVIKREAENIATGHLVIASVSSADFKTIPIPDRMREMLKPYTPADGGA